MALRLPGVRFVGKADPPPHQSQLPQLYMSVDSKVTAQIQINSHSVRNLESLDKKISFTAEAVDEEDFKLKFAQWLTAIPAGTIIRATFEIVED